MVHINWSEQSTHYKFEEDKEEILRLYPDWDIDKHYYLWMSLSFYWQYVYSNILFQCILRKKDGSIVDIPDNKLRHIFPNKNYHTACAKSGRKYCNKGIILKFDTYEELSECKELMIIWNLEYPYDKYDGKSDVKTVKVIQIYDLSFCREKGKHNYTIEDRARCLQSLEKNDNIEKWLEEYQDIFVLKDASFNDNGDIEIMSVMSCMTQENRDELVTKVILSEDLDKMLDRLQGKVKLTETQVFYSSEVLKPEICSTRI